jgi:hypothetical protein
MTGLAGAAFGIFGKALAAPSKRKGRSQLKQARKLESVTKFQRAVQQRRAFLRQAREAQAAGILRGATSGASLESSGVQAEAQSLTTQRRQALGEQQDIFNRGVTIDFLSESAREQFAQAQEIESITEGIGEIGDAIMNMQGAAGG